MEKDQQIPIEKLFEIIGKKDTELQLARENIAILINRLSEADKKIKALEGKKKGKK